MPKTAALVRGRFGRSELVEPNTLSLAAGRQHTAQTIMRAWYEGKSENTIRSCAHDLAMFATFLSRALGISPPMDIDTALTNLFKQSAPSAHEIVLAFRHFLAKTNMAPASINRQLATLRSVSRLARMLGLITWYLEVPGLKAEKRRRTAGPTIADVRRLLEATCKDNEAETRAYAIIITFFCVGLRVSELCGLNYEETDLRRRTTWIKGKGKREKELVPLPASVIDAICRYLVYRGTAPGPLFQAIHSRAHGRHNRVVGRGGRLESRSVLRIVRRLGQSIGLHVWCHALRHSSITAALEVASKAGIGLDKVRAHSRHAAIATLMVYADDHEREQTQRTLADLVANRLTKGEDEGRK